MQGEEALTGRAGRAVRWRMAHLLGVNLIFLLRLVILARIVDPDAFGLFAIGMVAIGILLSATEFGMVPALVQAESPDRRHYDVAWTINLSRGLGTAALVYLIAPWISELANEPRATAVAQVLALHPLLLATSSIRLADLQRRLDFRPLAILHLGEAVANTVFAIALAPTLGVWALVAGSLAGSLCRLVISFSVAPYRPRLRFDSAASKALISFGRWIFIGALLTTIGGATLRLLISRQLGAAELGLYYLATRATFLFVGTVIDVGTSVSFPIYSRLQENREEALRVFRAVFTATSALVVPVFLLLAALAPALVEHVLDAQWQGAADVLRVLALVCILTIFGDVTNPLWQGMGQPWRTTLIEGLQFAVLLPVAWWLTADMGVVGAGLAWVPAVLLTQLISAIFLPRVLPVPLRELVLPALAILLVSVVGAGWALWLYSNFASFGGVIAAAISGGLLCGAMLWLSDRSLGLGLRRSLVRIFPQLDALL